MPAIDYSGTEVQEPKKKESKLTIVDDNGKRIEKLTGYQRDRLYSKAKELKGEIRDTLNKRGELKSIDPESNEVKKMEKGELNPVFVKKIESYKNIMTILDDNPEVRNTEKLRREI